MILLDLTLKSYGLNAILSGALTSGEQLYDRLRRRAVEMNGGL